MRVLLEHGTTAIRLLLLVGAEVHLPDYLREHFVHVGPALRRGFHEGTAPRLGQGSSFGGGDFSLVLQIGLVADEQNGHPLLALDPRDQLLHGLDVLEGLMVGQRVNYDESLAVLYVQVPHRRELFRSRRVQNFEYTGTVVHLDLLPVKVLNGGVVLLHEAARHELHR